MKTTLWSGLGLGLMIVGGDQTFDDRLRSLLELLGLLVLLLNTYLAWRRREGS